LLKKHFSLTNFYLVYRYLYTTKLIIKHLIDFGVDEEKSSHYGLYMLGFTCATRVETESSYSLN